MALASAAAVTDQSLAERLVDRAGGNPLFLEQLLRHSQEDAQTSVPGTVQALVQARVDLLDPLNRRALQAASILGRTFLSRPSAICWPTRISTAPTWSHTPCCGMPGIAAASLMRSSATPSTPPSCGAGARSCTGSPRNGTRHGISRCGRNTSTGQKTPGRPPPMPRPRMPNRNLLRYERALELAERGHRLATSAEDRARLGLYAPAILRELGRAQEAMQGFRGDCARRWDSLAQCRAWIGVASVRAASRGQ